MLYIYNYTKTKEDKKSFCPSQRFWLNIDLLPNNTTHCAYFFCFRLSTKQACPVTPRQNNKLRSYYMADIGSNLSGANKEKKHSAPPGASSTSEEKKKGTTRERKMSDEKAPKKKKAPAPSSADGEGASASKGDKYKRRTEKSDIVVKVGMVGDSEVGKTSLMVRYVEGKFDEDYIVTLGTAWQHFTET